MKGNIKVESLICNGGGFDFLKALNICHLNPCSRAREKTCFLFRGIEGKPVKIEISHPLEILSHTPLFPFHIPSYPLDEILTISLCLNFYSYKLRYAMHEYTLCLKYNAASDCFLLHRRLRLRKGFLGPVLLQDESLCL